MDRYQRQRFELKYRIPERLGASIRRFVRCHLQPDPFMAGRPELCYPVYSLYLDSPGMRLHQATINGDRNRFKLRVRYYTGDPQAPVYCEVKYRRDRVICKQRAMVRRQALPDLLRGRAPGPADLMVDRPGQLASLLRFHELQLALQAGPKTRVGYRREAWSACDGSVRVTLDRDVRTAPEFRGRLTDEPDGMVPVFGKQVILEIKFTDRYPLWLREMVRSFHLRQVSAAKYVDGVLVLGEHLFLNGSGRDEVRRLQALRRTG